ncbi:diguanylate cyclase [Blautia sp.]|uniref:diguanylate cyclase n=1 Tax=Blautia sp. TaxID=1955243 RepID=UPI003AB13B63
MPDEKVLQVAILIWGCVFCAIAALCIFLSSNYDREKRRYLILMESFTSLLLLMDAMAHIFSGYPGVPGNVMVRISSFLVFLLSDVVLLCFHIYVCVYLFSKRERRTLKRVKAGYVIAAAGVAFVVISQFTHWYYYIDGDNCYHRAPLYIMSILFSAAGLLIDLTLLLQYKKRVSRKLLFSMLSCIVLPAVAAAVQVFRYGMSLIDFSVGISMIIMFIVTMTELNQEMYQLISREGKIKERLEIATILNKCIAELISGEDEDAAISNLLRIISGYFDGDRSYIVQIDEKRNVCTNTYEYAMNGVTAEKDNLQEVPMEMLDIWMDSFRKNGLYYIPDIEEEQGQPYYETLKMQDITRLLAVPLNSDGKIIGFLGVDNPRLHYEDHTLLSSIQYFLTDSLKAKERKACLQYMSYRDMLTTLYNRNRYIQILEGMQAKTVIKTGVAYIDINGLKRVNDLYGHEAGDRLIINTARSMLAILPENAYRVGGDEFVLICFDMDEKIFRSKVRDICDSIAAKRISVSVGVVWEESSSELETMLRRADDLMYAEKKKYYEKHGTM